MSAPLDALLARLQGVKRCGDGFVALCPAHEDHSPSLSVSKGRDGRVLLHCFGGCSVESVCEALQIRVSDLFSGLCDSRKPEPGIVRNAQKQLTGLRSCLTPRDRERAVTVVLANETNLDAAIARTLALAVEGELVQVALDGKGQ